MTLVLTVSKCLVCSLWVAVWEVCLKSHQEDGSVMYVWFETNLMLKSVLHVKLHSRVLRSHLQQPPLLHQPLLHQLRSKQQGQDLIFQRSQAVHGIVTRVLSQTNQKQQSVSHVKHLDPVPNLRQVTLFMFFLKLAQSFFGNGFLIIVSKLVENFLPWNDYFYLQC